MKKRGKFLDDLNRSLESRYKIFNMTVADGAVEMICSEAMRRDTFYDGRRSKAVRVSSSDKNYIPNDHRADIYHLKASQVNEINANWEMELHIKPRSLEKVTTRLLHRNIGHVIIAKKCQMMQTKTRASDWTLIKHFYVRCTQKYHLPELRKGSKA